jgi:hypothetical protein
MNKIPTAACFLSAFLLIVAAVFSIDFLAQIQQQHTEFFNSKITDYFLSLLTFAIAFYTYKLVKGADDTAKKQLRAYVMLDEGEQLSGISTPEPKVIVTIKNFGKTPAHKVSSTILLKILPFPLSTDLLDAMKNIQPGDFISQDVLGPDAKHRLSSGGKSKFTIAELQDLFTNSKTKALYSFGKITYEDIFGNKHETRFIHFVGGLAPIKDGTMSRYEDGNTAT